MKRLIDEAKWMDGAVWTVLMVTVFSAYEIYFRGVVPDGLYWVRQVVIWGLAGAGYAVLSGWLERRRKEKDARGE